MEWRYDRKETKMRLPENAKYIKDENVIRFTCDIGYVDVDADEATQETVNSLGNESLVEDILLTRESIKNGTMIPVGKF